MEIITVLIILLAVDVALMIYQACNRHRVNNFFVINKKINGELVINQSLNRAAKKALKALGKQEKSAVFLIAMRKLLSQLRPGEYTIKTHSAVIYALKKCEEKNLLKITAEPQKCGKPRKLREIKYFGGKAAKVQFYKVAFTPTKQEDSNEL